GHGSHDRQQYKERQREYHNRLGNVVVRHHAEQDDEGDHKVDESAENSGERDDQTREVNLCDEPFVCHQTVARFTERMGEELPGQKRTIGENWIWDAVRRHARKVAKEEAEY